MSKKCSATFQFFISLVAMVAIGANPLAAQTPYEQGIRVSVAPAPELGVHAQMERPTRCGAT